MGMTTGLVRGCRPHKNSESSFFKSISPSRSCICFGKKRFRNHDTNLDNDDYDYYGGDDDDDSEGGRNHREFHELELYHRSPFRGSNSRWLTEGNRFYKQDSTEGAAARIEQRRPFIGLRSSSMASSTDSAYATVRGFDLINQIAQIHELENYEEEAINRSAHTEHVQEDIGSKMQSVGRFNVAKVPLKESSTQNTSSLDEPSTSKRGRFTVTPLKEKTTEAITTSTEHHKNPTRSVNPKETHCERTAREIISYDNDHQQTIKNNRFQVSKSSLNAILSSETNLEEKPSNAVDEVYKGNKKSSSADDPRSPDHKGRFLISKCNQSAAQLPIVKLFSPNRSSFVAPDIGTDLLLEIDNELFSRDQAYLETEL
ncbi:uncharacterized protein [Antedon mediterranea]|uniref:uncharacterized protein n=1 Tax=Antedon mediterranea TaxID=105859 RepID=UPI003AF63DBF